MAENHSRAKSTTSVDSRALRVTGPRAEPLDKRSNPVIVKSAPFYPQEFDGAKSDSPDGGPGAHKVASAGNLSGITSNEISAKNNLKKSTPKILGSDATVRNEGLSIEAIHFTKAPGISVKIGTRDKNEIQKSFIDPFAAAERKKTRKPYSSKWRVRLENWQVNEGPKAYLMVGWLVAQAIVFVYHYVYWATEPKYSHVRLVLESSLPIARGSAAVINLCCSVMLFTVCRNIISLLRTSWIKKFVPLDDHIEFHKAVGVSIAFWTAVHIIAHTFNFLHLYTNTRGIITETPEDLALFSWPGITGQVATVIFFLVFTSSLSKVRRKYYEIFWFAHHLIVIWFGILCVHGASGFITDNNGKAPGASFWKWWLPSAIVYTIERIFRQIKSQGMSTVISKVVQHPSKVIEVQIKKPSATSKPGQYVFLCCPELAKMEWHPFTLTSAPEEDFLSVHIRVVGDWTTKFTKRLGCQFEGEPETKLGQEAQLGLPKVWVDGPYGTASEDVFNYEVAVLVGAGIGVTPFASILKSIWYKVQNPANTMRLQKVYFYWVCREKDAFEWFQDLLLSLEAEDMGQFLEIHCHITAGLKDNEIQNIMIHDLEGVEDAVTGLRAGTLYGRPNWKEIFPRLAKTHHGASVGVFFCGPKPLAKELHRCSNTYTESKGTRFYFHKENF